MLSPVPTPVLWTAGGFCAGAGFVSALHGIVDGRRRAVRGRVLRSAASALVHALAAIAELPDLPVGLRRHLAALRELADEVARVAGL